MRGSFLITAGVMATLAAMAPSARAAQRLTPRNGFEMRCDHHAEVEGRTRLYLSAGEDSYIEFRPEEIAEIEHLPDPPAAPKTAENSSGPTSEASPKATTISRRAAKLPPTG